MNSFGTWANGQSLHALDRTHMAFGCDSPASDFLKRKRRQSPSQPGSDFQGRS